VQWQAVGADGHPVRGEYTFEVTGSPAAEVTPGIPALSAASHPGTTEASFSAQSPLYAGVRWLMYAALLAITGVATFGALMTSLERRGGTLSAELAQRLSRRASSLGLAAASVLLIANAARLQAQSYAVFGHGASRGRVALLMQSTWGMSYLAQVAGAFLAIFGLLLWRRSAAAGLAVNVGAALLLSGATAMGGHAASEQASISTVFADGIHILSAGVWLGTLLVLLLVVLPEFAREPDEERPRLLRTLLTSFSTVALVAGGLVVATGLIGALAQLNAISDLWNTPYGKVLDVKLLFVLIVFIAGGLNWRKFRGATFSTGSEVQLRRRATIEIAGAALVIALTSFLVAVPPPAHPAPTEPGNPIAAR
jgi:copper transport protein